MLEIINPSMVSLIQSILIILSGLVILIASIGILTFDKDMPNVVYVRIHVLGMIDVAGIVVFLALGQYMFAVMYLVLAPFLAHAMANAYFYGEDDYNTLYADDMVEDKYAALNAPDKLDDDAVEDDDSHIKRSARQRSLSFSEVLDTVVPCATSLLKRIAIIVASGTSKSTIPRSQVSIVYAAISFPLYQLITRCMV